MPRKPKPITEQLIAAIRKAERTGRTRYQIAAEAGVYQSQLARLVSGERRPLLDTAEKIASALGYDLCLVPKKHT